MRPILASFCLLAVLLLAGCATSANNGSDTNPTPNGSPTSAAQTTPTAGSDNGGTGGNGNPTQVPLSQYNAYAGGQDNMFYAFNADSGAQRWHYSIAGTPNKPWAVTGGVFVSTQAGYVYSFSKSGS
ncbi:MAG TPA: PQQ-binding-like beta-propeller repeat protein, partial [Ktedonobacterales bacterium]|nr:PQQ-binding-like beta-propeller repeat protein [Ktedonobacterales bacterium]